MILHPEMFLILLVFAIGFPFLLTISLSIMFYMEKEPGAGNKSLSIAFIIAIIGCIIFYYSLGIILLVITGSLLLILFSFLIPFKTNKNLCDTEPLSKYDERDIMFSRNELDPGTERYSEYYKRHPEKEALDNLFRNEPGLMSPDSLFYNKKAFDIAKEYDEKIEDLRSLVSGEIHKGKTIISPDKASEKIRKSIINAGGLDTGITKIKPYHFYSTKGRGDEYGNEIDSGHTYAIAFTVEMEHENVMAGPDASIVFESMKQYHNAAKIAIKIAEEIRNMGYDARAHIDGNYRVICPLIARDAGLGEIGRMGLLMTPRKGPRVRIAVVTTDMELIPDKYTKQYSAIDFCRMCKKCADCCPSQSISDRDPEIIDGVKRWKINSESCFIFWCKAGTDCGRCMAVCPYSHPDNFLHNLIRFGISKSKVFRYLALLLDDFFYGKKPVPWPLPKWMRN